ncbi:MAG: class I SAM-dependent methyltransferase [Bacteroidetes bacterium]|nr:class I SAM-dependent methyltransferase [Bacteroidota bacterium]
MKIDQYQIMSKYYDLLVCGRDHIINQEKVISKLINSSHIKLLDAACGTGIENSGLVKAGKEIFANDGSIFMLQELNKKKHDYKRIFNEEWINLDRIYEIESNYDVIYILGNTISHCPTIEYLLEVFIKVRQGLNKNGMFLFDSRNWIPVDGDEPYIQQGRKTNEKRVLLNSEIKIEDDCNYQNGKQIITYFVNTNNTHESFSLEYQIIPQFKFEELIILAGFNYVEIFDMKNEGTGYPYIIYRAK